jgi:hypothetical protein
MAVFSYDFPAKAKINQKESKTKVKESKKSCFYFFNFFYFLGGICFGLAGNT